MTLLPHPRPGTRDISARPYDGRWMVWRWEKLPETGDDDRPAYGWLLVDVRDENDGKAHR